MQIYCLINEFTDTAAETTLSNILNQLGFFYSWITPETKTDLPSIYLEYLSPKTVKTEKENHFYIPCLLPPARLTKKQISWNIIEFEAEQIPILGDSKLKDDQDNCYSIDLIGNVYYHLNRIEEQIYTHPNQMDPQSTGSILETYGDFQLPVVDIMIDHFGQWLEQKAKEMSLTVIKKTPFPQGESFGLALTHDVDFIRAFHPLKKWYLKLKAFLGLSPGLTPATIEQQDQDKWGFDQLLPLYQQKKWPATFFFIARHLEGSHFRYRINSRKMRTIIRQLSQQGHEIALHPSRYAFEHRWRYLIEKLRLQFISRTKISGMRHHYLRGLFPGLWHQAAKLGLAYETTLCHRRKSGYRSGTTRPYFPAEINPPVLAIPTVFFENTLPDEGADPEQSIQEIKELLNEVKKRQGLFTILWHTNHILQPANYRLIWQELIKLLEQEEPFISTLHGHTKWVQQRQEIQLKYFQIETKKMILECTFSAELDKFSLRFPFTDFDAQTESAGIQLTQKQDLLTITNEQNQTTCLITVTII